VQNVQFLSSDSFTRKYQAIECGVQSCLLMPYTVDGEFKGCVEFFSMEEWPEIPKLVEKLAYYSTKYTRKEIDPMAFKV